MIKMERTTTTRNSHSDEDWTDAQTGGILVNEIFLDLINSHDWLVPQFPRFAEGFRCEEK